ncbi:DUF680 domain-containing protein [Mesorhizobium sp. CO1-1-8]|uniref:DUF680 domain-containing protein n=1 Tax=Mesorhizobium sp. CO1-1-8 TaxID=2876631 RepID=UPI001CD0E154|nr:DUF680 domain-containing protein [Mesorhizobium sp. CO1-1-8]MBZ9773820.1 DUF680 domain-containing protein [Mesorhizobium sp. CO1-1-8]
MNKILIAAAAVLAITGSAFAGSDNFGSNGANQPAVTSIDSAHTSSVRNSGGLVEKLLNSSGDTTQKSAPQGADRNLFGNN